MESQFLNSSNSLAIYIKITQTLSMKLNHRAVYYCKRLERCAEKKRSESLMNSIFKYETDVIVEEFYKSCQMIPTQQIQIN